MLEPQSAARVHAAGQWPGYRRPLGLGLLVLLLAWPGIKRKHYTFSRVAKISKVQSSSDPDYFHARDLPCSRVKSHDDPISDCRGDSAVLCCFIYIVSQKTSIFLFLNNFVKN